MSTETPSKIPDERMKKTKREKKIQTVRPAGLNTRRSFSYTITIKKSCFDCAVTLYTMQMF
jgi:hypothetical protein